MDTIAVLTMVGLLIVLSAICSGLNIALMTLKPSELRRQVQLGNKYAKRVLPFRTHAHLSLASILLMNVAVIAATSLVLGSQFNSLIAGICSTLLIVIFGEVIPQALFASRALRFCSFFAPLLHIMVYLTFPISKPLQLLLDAMLGPERATLPSRGELGLLIGEHAASEDSELDKNELEIMRGALSLSEKRVRDIITPIEHVYWLTPQTIVDSNKIEEVKHYGRSRVPIFNRGLTTCYGVLLMKDLVDVDFENNTYRLSELPLHPTRIIGSMTALDTLFRAFIGARSHLMPVEKDGDIVGIVTIEDLIEEIIGQEIEDETDKRKRQTASVPA